MRSVEQKLSKMAKFWLSKSIFYVKNIRNFLKKNFIEEYHLRGPFFVIDIFWKIQFFKHIHFQRQFSSLLLWNGPKELSNGKDESQSINRAFGLLTCQENWGLFWLLLCIFLMKLTNLLLLIHYLIKTNVLYFSHQMDQIMTKNESRSIHDVFWWNFSSFVTITNYKNKKNRLTYIFIFIVNFLLNYIGIKWTKKMAKTIDKWLKMKTDA